MTENIMSHGSHNRIDRIKREVVKMSVGWERMEKALPLFVLSMITVVEEIPEHALIITVTSIESLFCSMETVYYIGICSCQDI